MKQEILKQCTVEGNVVKLPAGQLDRKVYQEVAKALTQINGKWTGGKVMGFVFKSDPTDLLAEIAGGKKRNIKKEFQFYGTPVGITRLLVSMADLHDYETILEPSAGQGAIIKTILEYSKENVKVDYYELMGENQQIIKETFMPQSINFKGENFLECIDKYDRIIANPPFNKNQDIIHLRKMYDCLNEKGIVVSIAATGWIQNSTKACKEFREWLDDDSYMENEGRGWKLFGNIGEDAQFQRKNGDTVYLEMLDSKTFKSSGANVKTVIIKIEKT